MALTHQEPAGDLLPSWPRVALCRVPRQEALCFLRKEVSWVVRLGSASPNPAQAGAGFLGCPPSSHSKPRGLLKPGGWA